MRLSAVILLPFLFALPATVPAWAETPAPATAPAAHHARVTWQKRFEQANTSHDGHLTLEQARTGYKTVARHFMEIDVAGHGYVTEDDVRAWHKQRAGDFGGLHAGRQWNIAAARMPAADHYHHCARHCHDERSRDVGRDRRRRTHRG